MYNGSSASAGNGNNVTRLKEKKKKGFTLAELLIVVAIIAVLAAIAIPVFSDSTESAREANDVYAMRQAASAAVELLQGGITDKASANAAGFNWYEDPKGIGSNAYGVYDPTTGSFLAISSRDAKNMAYGKGTDRDGKTRFKYGGSDRLAYAANFDYTEAVVMVSIYPFGNDKHVDVYWKYCKGSKAGQYVGGVVKANDPKYSIRIPLD